jgi:hypothetical protein
MRPSIDNETKAQNRSSSAVRKRGAATIPQLAAQMGGDPRHATQASTKPRTPSLINP